MMNNIYGLIKLPFQGGWGGVYPLTQRRCHWAEISQAFSLMVWAEISQAFSLMVWVKISQAFRPDGMDCNKAFRPDGMDCNKAFSLMVWVEISQAFSLMVCRNFRHTTL